MSTLSCDFQRLVHRLRYRYTVTENDKLNSILSNILWYSVPVVYINWFVDIKNAENKIAAAERRRFRYREYVRSMALHNQYYTIGLLTLTFKNEVLNNTSSSSRLDYVRKYLNLVSRDYFCCIDFGKRTGREHYHAIVVFDVPLEPFVVGKKKKQYLRVRFDDHLWSKGFYSIRPLPIDSFNIYRSLNYVLKSTDYTLKALDYSNDVKPFHKRGTTVFKIIRPLTEVDF